MIFSGINKYFTNGIENKKKFSSVLQKKFRNIIMAFILQRIFFPQSLALFKRYFNFLTADLIHKKYFVMNNRRYFLIQGTLATTAMFALKPFTSIGNTLSQFTGFNRRYGKLVFLHTANMNHSGDYQVINYIKEIKNNNTNAILLKAGQDKQEKTGRLTYDVSMNGSKSFCDSRRL